jgi:NAD(P)-dependent dehydrogenase (short-subunit alcohol dehydrogenase family)
MDLGLAGKVAVVTGASKGIGLAITRTLVDEGVHVIAGARDMSDELTALVEQGMVQPVKVDLSTAAGPAELVAVAVETGRLDILIDYSAGKAALTNFCKALSKGVGPKGIRVNTVSPGPVATDLWLGDDGVIDGGLITTL